MNRRLRPSLMLSVASGASAPQLSNSGDQYNEGPFSVTATVVGTGSVSATVLLQGSNVPKEEVSDDTLVDDWTTIATLSPSGTTTATAAASSTTSFHRRRINITALSANTAAKVRYCGP